MVSRRAVVVGAGPCGLVALKELREAGHDAIAVDERPDVGGLFCRAADTQYDSLYLTISNFFMAFSDFPPPEMAIRYSSKAAYGRYLEAYADHFGLRPHLRLRTQVVRAAWEDGRWRVTLRCDGGEPEVIEAEILIVATGSNHAPRRAELPGFTGTILHSSDYRGPEAFAGQRVLVVGAGESAFDVAADLGEAGVDTTLWSRSPIAPAPRFPLHISFLPWHDELAIMKAEHDAPRLRVSDFLEVMTTSRMANAAPLWAYTTVRHVIFAALRGTPAQGRLLSYWNRAQMDDPLLGDQISVPTKSARLCTATARGQVGVVVAKEARFDGRDASFEDVKYQGRSAWMSTGTRPAEVRGIDAVILCTGYQSDSSWLEAPGLDWSPRSWFKHCFPAGWGDRLMFLGWARPHQGGIPACAEMLSRYIALIQRGDLSLPEDYAERAAREGRDEHTYYVRARHSPNLVDYFAFMDSVARLIGCLPDPPSRAALRVKYWMYPNWPVWYRLNGPGARPDVVERVMDALPLGRAYLPNPFILLALGFSLMQPPIDALIRPRAGLVGHWAFKAKKFLLHDNA
ncbi:MAG TPA: NAD(P)/FAD-dependent oxidoreductase [Myxococcota bacterium]|nr:NAD(P)/FAD-dependent oxidoreductase [Myxococcota bacterium]